jgi:hypothetical protein
MITTEEILVNKEIDFGRFRNDLGSPNLGGDEVKHGLDIQFWVNISKKGDIFETWKLFIIEIFYRLEKETKKTNIVIG